MPKAAAEKETKPRATRKAAESKTAKKPPKDKNAPKKGLSAYLIFSNEWRDRVKTENPEAKFGEIGRLLGAKWKELPDDEKKEYQQKSEDDKERAAKEKAAYDEDKKNSSGDGDD